MQIHTNHTEHVFTSYHWQLRLHLHHNNPSIQTVLFWVIIPLLTCILHLNPYAHTIIKRSCNHHDFLILCTPDCHTYTLDTCLSNIFFHFPIYRFRPHAHVYALVFTPYNIACTILTHEYSTLFIFFPYLNHTCVHIRYLTVHLLHTHFLITYCHQYLCRSHVFQPLCMINFISRFRLYALPYIQQMLSRLLFFYRECNFNRKLQLITNGSIGFVPDL